MRAMVSERPGAPLVPHDLPRPAPAADRLLIEIEACAVCRTDLHVVDGELPGVPYPVVPGHQIVGRVAKDGAAGSFAAGDRVGVPWLGYACGHCRYCVSGRENLCDRAAFTGYTLPGGYAECVAVDPAFAFALSGEASAADLAPLLCAGMIGYRALRMCGEAEHVGLYGFGAAAHLLAQVLRHQGRAFYAFTRAGDTAAQRSAEALGARWAGDSDRRPDRALDAAIVFAPVGALVPAALRAVAKGGIVVCAGIHMSDIPAMPYSLLWEERQLRSVANLTRADGAELLAFAARFPLQTRVTRYPLADANRALEDLREGRFTGSAVLCVDA
ncbi:MAG TPA: zinc-dependent alcohol dehydrogenase family protein [Gammaproteobacteria bacterium]